MNTSQAVEQARAVIRRQHKSPATEQTYLHWLRHYIAALRELPRSLTSEQKLERFLTPGRALPPQLNRIGMTT